MSEAWGVSKMGAGHFVGRVGGLAVALGVGAAVSFGSASAWAEDTTGAGGQGSTSSTGGSTASDSSGPSAGMTNSAARSDSSAGDQSGSPSATSQDSQAHESQSSSTPSDSLTSASDGNSDTADEAEPDDPPSDTNEQITAPPSSRSSTDPTSSSEGAESTSAGTRKNRSNAVPEIDGPAIVTTPTEGSPTSTAWDAALPPTPPQPGQVVITDESEPSEAAKAVQGDNTISMPPSDINNTVESVSPQVITASDPTIIATGLSSSEVSGLASLLSPGTGTPAEATVMWVVAGAARREIGDTDAESADTADERDSGETIDLINVPVVSLAAFAIAAPTPVHFDTLAELAAATGQGVILYHGGVEPWTSWSSIVDNSANWSYVQNPPSPNLGDLVEATVTYTYTASIPESQEFQNWYESTALPALGYAPSDYSLWIVTAKVDDGSNTILGGTHLDVGSSFEITGMAWGGGSVAGRNANYMVLMPSGITPIFPRLDTSPPTAPFLDVSGVTSTTISLKASGGSDDVGVVGYNIYRNGVKLNTESLLSSGQVLTETGLLASTLYIYTATAVDRAGNESLQRATISVPTLAVPTDTVAPTPPVIASSTITPTSVTLTPSGGTDNVGIVGYNIYRDGNRVKINDTLIPVGGYAIDFELVPDSVHYYYARAVDAAGNESPDSRAVRVNTLDAPHADPNSPAESNWEVFNTVYGWIPIFGEGLSLVSFFIDSIQLASAIASGDRNAILDEIKDLAGDTVGLLPFGRLVSKPTEDLIDILALLILNVGG